MGSKAYLVIQRNAQIIADGTAEAPIVFTSEAPVGERKVGDWGGIVINGKAPVNLCPDMDDCNIEGEADTGTYGGNVYENLHPVIKESNAPGNLLALAGNFNLTNTGALVEEQLRLGLSAPKL